MISELICFLQKRVPGQVVIQLTDRCNAHCPQCGMRVTEPFPRARLHVNHIKRILDHAASNGVKAVSFTGGEPFLYFKDLVELIRHAGRCGIEYIRTGTNGFFLNRFDSPGFEGRIHKIAEMLARTPLRNFWISIDSASPHHHESMRGFPGIIKGIEKALPIFHEHGIFPSANLGINRNMGGDPLPPSADFPGRFGPGPGGFFRDTKKAFDRFFRFVTDLGFTIVNACYPMSMNGRGIPGNGLDAVYRADSKDAVASFTPHEKALLFRALFEVVPEHRFRVRIFSPLCSLYALSIQQTAPKRSPSHPCRGGIDFFFINAQDGDTYPCGYRGAENLGPYWDLSLKQKPETPFCRKCEWECFRDPSELLGPLAETMSHPISLLRKWAADPDFFRLWVSDILYYRSCGYFNGRMPPDAARMAVFKKHFNASTSFPDPVSFS